MFGSAMICIGLVISTGGEPWQLYLGHGLFMGLLGNAGLNAPLYVYVSHWFDRRRGSALALISSGAISRRLRLADRSSSAPSPTSAGAGP